MYDFAKGVKNDIKIPETKNIKLTETEYELETENRIDKSVSGMWSNFTKSNPKFKNEEIPQSDFFS
ncbi:hypothetical protein [Lacinutrix sp.]|uniref:hypothetical protein n=1 Tax=Lacinutrix sp. TaxID=1937692 RepID=UPI0025BD4A5B|nr:hypothetical protein [Lacinutrix sp.]